MTNNEFYDEDVAYEEYRQKRLQQLKKDTAPKQVETYIDESLLIKKSKSDRMIVHFFNEGFKKCNIMDVNLNKIVKVFNDIEFIRIDANLAPVLTTKLKIKTLPFLAMFRDGYFVDHIVGFEGFGRDEFEPKELIKVISKSEIMKKVA